MFSVYVTGTDTGIGKTLASCALLHALRGHGLRVAGMKPVASGSDRIGRFFLGIFKKAPATSRFVRCRVNGQAGYAMIVDDQPVTILTADIRDGLIKGVFIIRNPDKLARVAVG